MTRFLKPSVYPLRAAVAGVLLASLALCAASAAAVTAVFSDPLATPAPTADLRLPLPVIGVARAGQQLLAVGPRGLILRSADQGKTWRQVPSPVASDLVQIRFAGDSNGWIVGHDSVVLHTADGGNSWQLQMDGRRLLTLLRDTYGKAAAAGDDNAAALLREVDLALGSSASPDVLPQPLLDVVFDQHGHGFAVGAFGLVLRSDDNGDTWQPWIEHTDNDRRMHLYGLAEHQGTFYASGEQGLLLRLAPGSQRFEQIPTPYNGTWFGVSAYDHLLLAYGLRGTLYASRDGGAQWEQIKTGLGSSLVGIVDLGPRSVLVSQSGEMAALDRQELRVTALAPVSGEVYAATPAGRTGALMVSRASGPLLVQVNSSK